MLIIGLIALVALSCLIVGIAASRAVPEPELPSPFIKPTYPSLQLDDYDDYSPDYSDFTCTTHDKAALEQLKITLTQAQQMMGPVPQIEEQMKQVDEQLAFITAKELVEQQAAMDDVCPECGERFAMIDDYICEGCRASK